MAEREQNTIFSAPGAQQSVTIPAQTSSDRMKNDFGIEMPTEIAPLPSSGKVYPTNSTIHNVDAVEILPMTAYHEDILSNRALHKKGTVISELLRASLLDKTIDPRMLLSGDRSALLVAIRAAGYGTDYTIKYTCPECDVTAEHTFDLEKLGVKRLELEPVAPGLNEFSFQLPKLKKEVRFRFLTGADEEDLAATAAKKKKLGLTVEENVTSTLHYTLVSVDGITDRAKLAHFVRNCPAKDSAALRRYIRDHEPGIDMKQEVTCSNCSHIESEVSVDLTPEFFWPGSLK